MECFEQKNVFYRLGANKNIFTVIAAYLRTNFDNLLEKRMEENRLT